jgi:hypothetical protein
MISFKSSFRLSFLSVALLAASCCGLHAASNSATIENESLRVVFDLDSGRYSAVEKATGTVLFRNATMRLGLWDMSVAAMVTKRSAELVPVEDALGKGQTLRVTAEIAHDFAGWAPDKPGRADLELTLTLYDGRSALVLGGGVRNRISRSILIKNFTPMVDAELWPADQERSNPQTLDGHGAYGYGQERMNQSGLAGHADHGRGNNAVMPGLSRKSENNLLLTYQAGGKRRNFVGGGLTYRDFTKRVETAVTADGRLLAKAEAYDPVGLLLESGAAYQSADRFYIDLLESDPFAALETYARTAAKAQDAKPNFYNFPTLCMWYVMVTSNDNSMNTVDAVRQMDYAAQSGFLRYAPVAIRLVPETYHQQTGGNTPQGWWDDAHWQKFGYFKEPYETSAKFCQAIRERGGLPFIYVQTGMPSDDFAEAHPDWMLSNSIKYLKMVPRSHEQPHVRPDYSDPGMQQHMRKVWSDLGQAGLAGLMFDYPETGFAGEGGLDDPKSTATAAYRKIFELAREGLGPQAHIHERNLGEVSTRTSLPHERIPYSDMTLGLVDSQRIETDSSSFTAAQVARAALRWYKTRVFYLYDMDAKSLLFRKIHTKETEEVADPVLRRRSILTMLYVTAGRVLLADSFKNYSPEIIRDLSRLYPMHEERRTARPVDLLLPSAAGCPRVYQFQVTPDWHQVTLFNPDMAAPAKVSAPLSGDAAQNGALGLDPNAEYHAYDFWNNRLAGRFKGTDTLSQDLAPGEARMLSLRKVTAHPQVISSDRHLMQGMLELSEVRWENETLSGKAKIVAGEPLRIVIANNGRKPVPAAADGSSARLEEHPGNPDLTVLVMESAKAVTSDWRVTFESPNQ